MINTCHSALFFSYDLRPNTLHSLLNDFKPLCDFLACGLPVLIGIDTETRPCRRRYIYHPTAIIQLALRSPLGDERVYVIDLLGLTTTSALELDVILAPLFDDPKICKLGHGLVNDFKQLAKSYPHIRAFSQCRGILDTNTFMRRLYPREKRDYSLKYLTEHFLYFNLDKTCQMSDWGRRPLTSSQLHYAACDALVLLRLYDVMCFELDEISLKPVSNDNVFTIPSILVDFCSADTAVKTRTLGAVSIVNSSITDDQIMPMNCFDMQPTMKKQKIHIHFNDLQSDDDVISRSMQSDDVDASVDQQQNVSSVDVDGVVGGGGKSTNVSHYSIANESVSDSNSDSVSVSGSGSGSDSDADIAETTDSEINSVEAVPSRVIRSRPLVRRILSGGVINKDVVTSVATTVLSMPPSGMQVVVVPMHCAANSNVSSGSSNSSSSSRSSSSSSSSSGARGSDPLTSFPSMTLSNTGTTHSNECIVNLESSAPTLATHKPKHLSAVFKDEAETVVSSDESHGYVVILPRKRQMWSPLTNNKFSNKKVCSWRQLSA